MTKAAAYSPLLRGRAMICVGVLRVARCVARIVQIAA